MDASVVGIVRDDVNARHLTTDVHMKQKYLGKTQLEL
jgi:hypothetical protein